MAIARKQIGWSQESNLLWEISRQMEKLTGVAFNGGGGGSALTIKDEGTTLTTGATSIDFVGAGVTASVYGGTNVTVEIPLGGVVEITKSELDTLITNGELIPGQYYLISEVDIPLYGGTDIIMQAATTNQLALQGHGIFYTPKYNKDILGYNIWSKNVLIEASYGGGFFNVGEVVEFRDGADNVVGTGVWINENLIEWASGTYNDWRINSSYFIGQSSLSSATLTSIYNWPNTIDNSYGQKYIWGGRVWIHNSLDVGNPIDQFLLDGNWDTVPFNTDDYNVFIDEIHYDYISDRIIYRKDKFNNEVSYQPQTPYNNPSPIKAFQWGNGYDIGYDKGIADCSVLQGSYFECINFRGKNLQRIVLTQLSYIINMRIEGDDFGIYTINLSNASTIYGLTIAKSRFNQIKLDGGSAINELNISSASEFANNAFLLGSGIDNVRMYGSTLIFNSLSGQSGISNNYLTGSCQIKYNTLNSQCSINNISAGNYGNSSFNIQGNILNNNANISGMTLVLGISINNNNLESTGFNFTGLSYYSIVNTTAKNCGTLSYDLSSATYIYNPTTTKTIFKNSADIPRLSFYDALDVLQIVNVNA